MKLGGVPVQAASVGGITECGLVAREGVICHSGPEPCRGKLAVPVAPAVLVEIIREPVHRPAPGISRAAGPLVVDVPRASGPAWWGAGGCG